MGAAKDVTYVPDHDGIANWASSSDMSAAMMTMAELLVRYARQTSPRSDKAGAHYADQFAVTSARVRAGYKHEERSGAVVTNSSEYAIPVEMRHHVMAKAATYIDGRKRWWGMTKRQRASAQRRVEKNIRKRRRAGM